MLILLSATFDYFGTTPICRLDHILLVDIRRQIRDWTKEKAGHCSTNETFKGMVLLLSLQTIEAATRLLKKSRVSRCKIEALRWSGQIITADKYRCCIDGPELSSKFVGRAGKICIKVINPKGTKLWEENSSNHLLCCWQIALSQERKSRW